MNVPFDEENSELEQSDNEDNFDSERNISDDIISLSNSFRHLANADVIADVKSKIIVSRQHFFADVIFFFAISKVQNYQKTREKSLHPNKYVLTIYFKEF